MKKSAVILTVRLIIIIIFIISLWILSNILKEANETPESNTIKHNEQVIRDKPFYQYSENDNIFKWNLYNKIDTSFKIDELGYKYYIFNEENNINNQNKLVIAYSSFTFEFDKDNIKCPEVIIEGKMEKKESMLKKDLRNKWKNVNNTYQSSDIMEKYDIKRKVINYSEDSINYFSYMDIYINSNDEIVYAVPNDIRGISYVSDKEMNTNINAVKENMISLDGEKSSNIENLIDSLDEPNYALISNDLNKTKLTYVWKIFENYYFYYTMTEDIYYYLDGTHKYKSSLTGNSISDFDYGIVKNNYVYYTNNELAKLFDSIQKKYQPQKWISL